MSVAPWNSPRALAFLGSATAVVVAILLVNHLMGASGQARPQLASQATVGAWAEKSAPTLKERRYQATIENWRRYRATGTAEAH